MTDRFQELVLKSLTGTILPDEERELDTFLAQDKAKREEYAVMRDIDTLFNIREGARAGEIAGIRRRIREAVQLENKNNNRFYGINKKRLLQCAALLIPLFLTLSIYFMVAPGRQPACKDPDITALARNLAPGNAKAYLSSGEDTVSLQGTHINARQIPEKIRKKTEMRVLTVPRGGEYNITLADGTKVWLNSESKLIYPAGFEASERVVELEGEAYFEVAKMAGKPFTIKTKDVYTRVLGTSFGLCAYKEDAVIRNILVTGSVEMSRNGRITLLEPGKEALFDTASGEITVVPVDVRKATALKEGRFFFDDEPLSGIFSELERWYDVHITLEDKEIAEMKFYGVIRKDRDFSFIVEMMRQTHKLDFQIEGKNIKVIKKIAKK